MNREDITLRLRGLGIPQWRLAKQMGICENTLQRRLRDLKEADAQEMLKALDEIIEADKK